MSEKLCLQWNDFRANVNSAFGRLRDDKEFSDVTLACEDGQQMEAHKVILAASSSIFEKILQKNKHPHPLIYLRGFQSKDLVSILDFLYFGEANVYQENLDSFLAIAEEIKLEGLAGKTASDVVEQQDNCADPQLIYNTREIFKTPTTNSTYVQNIHDAEEANSKVIAIYNKISGYLDLEALDEKVKSMMERSQKMIPAGKQLNGTPMRATAMLCKVCGKEGRVTDIRDHIEANHLEGVSIPCDFCGKTFSARAYLRVHKTKFHK